MPPARRAALVLLVAAATACHAAGWRRAQADLATGRFARALAAYDRLAHHAATPAERARALTGAARAAEGARDAAAAERRYEAAITPELPGASAEALYRLGRLVEPTDRPRAMSLYYRAAANAEKHLARGFPYREATERMLVLSMERR